MRHNNKINHLGRTYSHREAMLANMANSLIKHKRIFTTVAKAKELRQYVEPLITKSKEDTTHSRRMVFKNLHNKSAITELFKEISQKIGDRPGGYTRIIKTGYRLGDNTAMCFIELVDYNENMLKSAKQAGKAKTRRSRRKQAEVSEVVGSNRKQSEVSEVSEVAEVDNKKDNTAEGARSAPASIAVCDSAREAEAVEESEESEETK